LIFITPPPLLRKTASEFFFFLEIVRLFALNVCNVQESSCRGGAYFKNGCDVCDCAGVGYQRLLHRLRRKSVQIAFDFVGVMERTPGPAGLDRSSSEAAASAPRSSGTASVAAATGMSWFSRGWVWSHASLPSLRTVCGRRATSTQCLIVRLRRMAFDLAG
jgi:hypothetical protein